MCAMQMSVLLALAIMDNVADLMVYSASHPHREAPHKTNLPFLGLS